MSSKSWFGVNLGLAEVHLEIPACHEGISRYAGAMIEREKGKVVHPEGPEINGEKTIKILTAVLALWFYFHHAYL